MNERREEKRGDGRRRRLAKQVEGEEEEEEANDDEGGESETYWTLNVGSSANLNRIICLHRARRASSGSALTVRLVAVSRFLCSK